MWKVGRDSMPPPGHRRSSWARAVKCPSSNRQGQPLGSRRGPNHPQVRACRQDPSGGACARPVCLGCICRCGKCGSAESQHPCGFPAGGQCGNKCGSAESGAGPPSAPVRWRTAPSRRCTSWAAPFTRWQQQQPLNMARRSARHSPPSGAGLPALPQVSAAIRQGRPGSKTEPGTPCICRPPVAMPCSRNACPRCAGAPCPSAGAARPVLGSPCRLQA